MKAGMIVVGVVLAALVGCGEVPPVTIDGDENQLNHSLFEMDSPCCMAMTASCLACSTGETVESYCENNPFTMGCPDSGPLWYGHNCRSLEVWTPVKRAWCCENEGLGCLGEGEPCDQIGTPYFPALYCEPGLMCVVPEPQGNPFGDPPGGICERPAPVCCLELNAECFACHAGQSVEDYCAANPSAEGCEPQGEPEPSVLDCTGVENMTLDQWAFCCESQGLGCL